MLNDDDRKFLVWTLSRLIRDRQQRQAIFDLVYWHEVQIPEIDGRSLDVAVVTVKDLSRRTMKTGKQGLVVLIEVLLGYEYIGEGEDRVRLEGMLAELKNPPPPPPPEPLPDLPDLVNSSDDMIADTAASPLFPDDQVSIAPAVPLKPAQAIGAPPTVSDTEVSGDGRTAGGSPPISNPIPASVWDIPPTDVILPPNSNPTPENPRIDATDIGAEPLLLPGTGRLHSKSSNSLKRSAIKALLIEMTSAEKGEMWSEAIETGEHILKLDANHAEGKRRTAEAYYQRNVAHWRNKRYDDAIADCTRALELEPNNARYAYSRGYSHHDKGDYVRAIADYTRAIELDGNVELAFIERGRSYHLLGDYDNAITDYSRAIALAPRNAQYLYLRSLAHRAKGSKNLALRDLELAAALGHPPAKDDLRTWK